MMLMRKLTQLGLLSLSAILLSLIPTAVHACNPYRIGYEKAINQGIIQRAPLVNGPKDAYQQFTGAVKRGDRIEAAVRAVQYLVIVSEASTPDTADLERLELENFIVNHFHKPVEVSVPMLTVILPHNLFCPVARSTTP